VRTLYRSERLSLLRGGLALGGLAGGAAAIALGNQNLWVIILASAPFLAAALYLTSNMLVDALRRDARGCATAAGMHAAALLAWPFMSLFTPVSAYLYFTAPVLAIATLVLFASCWSGPSRAVYRLAAQGAVVALVAAHQGVIVLMAN
jgi:hypothetical protein